jgi:hypothetical protein
MVATEKPILDQSFLAGSTWCANGQYYAVKCSTTPNRVVACSAVSDAPLGVLVVPGTTGRDVVVRMIGITKAMAKGTIAQGGKITCSTASGFIAQTASGYIWGFALEAATTGQLFKAFINVAGGYYST